MNYRIASSLSESTAYIIWFLYIKSVHDSTFTWARQDCELNVVSHYMCVGKQSKSDKLVKQSVWMRNRAPSIQVQEMKHYSYSDNFYSANFYQLGIWHISRCFHMYFIIWLLQHTYVLCFNCCAVIYWFHLLVREGEVEGQRGCGKGEESPTSLA